MTVNKLRGSTEHPISCVISSFSGPIQAIQERKQIELKPIVYSDKKCQTNSAFHAVSKIRQKKLKSDSKMEKKYRFKRERAMRFENFPRKPRQKTFTRENLLGERSLTERVNGQL